MGTPWTLPAPVLEGMKPPPVPQEEDGNGGRPPPLAAALAEKPANPALGGTKPVKLEGGAAAPEGEPVDEGAVPLSAATVMA